jgi:hypothetical protein
VLGLEEALDADEGALELVRSTLGVEVPPPSPELPDPTLLLSLRVTRT